MEEPLYLTMFRPGEGFDERDPLVMSTPVSLATTEHQAQQQNQLAKHGDTETLLAGSTAFWKRKLSRALIFGFASGAVVTLAANFLI